MVTEKSNIVLIGMAGAGKSCVGRLLAHKLNQPFIDTDDLIVENLGRPLQEIIDTDGPMNFCRIEEEVLLTVNVRNHVIATGGSSIYSDSGMNHLGKEGVIILLRVNLGILQKRVGETSERGLVKRPDQSFAELFVEREPLYEKYASISINCSHLSCEEVCSRIIDKLQLNRPR